MKRKLTTADLFRGLARDSLKSVQVPENAPPELAEVLKGIKDSLEGGPKDEMSEGEQGVIDVEGQSCE